MKRGFFADLADDADFLDIAWFFILKMPCEFFELIRVICQSRKNLRSVFTPY